MESGFADPGCPALPPELEREIFETCALSRPSEIPKLLLVSPRVKEWVEPLLYRTLVVEAWVGQARVGEVETTSVTFPRFTNASLLSALASKHFRPHDVRHLLLYEMDMDSGTAEKVFARCTGIENLWINCALDELGPLIAPLPLKHLYAHVLPLLRTLPPPHVCFSLLTHLEVMDWEWEEADLMIWSGLSLLPQLTHFSFDTPILAHPVRELLETSKSLSVLVFLDIHECPSLQELSHDVRFVQMLTGTCFEDWQRGVHSGEDYWHHAESVIAKRRSGEIDAGQYQISGE
ncbi:hypothetical protein C8R44DRAFT_412011 [Mycena epipterygia]|nr:hypothetical protein C8R44DRAFT_412011 [Mycena epipterygia]